MLKKIACICLSLSFLAITSCGGDKTSEDESSRPKTSVDAKDSTENKLIEELEQKLAEAQARNEKALIIKDLQEKLAAELNKNKTSSEKRRDLIKDELEEVRDLEKLREEIRQIREQNKSPEQRKQEKFQRDFSTAKEVIGLGAKTFGTIAEAIKLFANKPKEKTDPKTTAKISITNEEEDVAAIREKILLNAKVLVKELQGKRLSNDSVCYFGELHDEIVAKLIDNGYFSGRTEAFAIRSVSGLRALKALAENNNVVFEIEGNQLRASAATLKLTFVG